ncbi:uncharacterized protein LOC141620743 [Silene latifolia]|uniref:uncharacterized protein LOC141620743 n=1 Tax=Silene latifolia TaxID=37657 RepID=UPI003D76FA8E
MAQINHEQKVECSEYVSENLTNLKKRLSENIDELWNEVVSVRSAMDQQFHEFEERLKEEKQKNQQLVLEVEQLWNLQFERIVSNNRSDQHEEQHTKCCQIIVVNGSLPMKFQSCLLEYLIGMKVFAADRPDGKCLNVVHPPSSCTFSLTCVNNSALSEVELLYNVISLGTFSTVAPEWMREDIMFSMKMCPIFFKKLSLVVKRQ